MSIYRGDVTTDGFMLQKYAMILLRYCFIELQNSVFLRQNSRYLTPLTLHFFWFLWPPFPSVNLQGANPLTLYKCGEKVQVKVIGFRDSKKHK